MAFLWPGYSFLSQYLFVIGPRQHDVSKAAA